VKRHKAELNACADQFCRSAGAEVKDYIATSVCKHGKHNFLVIKAFLNPVSRYKWFEAGCRLKFLIDRRIHCCF
jgi:hypothetical protein